MANLADVVSELKKQGSTLDSVQKLLEAQDQRDIAQERKDREEDRERRTQGFLAGQPKGFMSGLKQGVSEATGFGWLSKILGGIFGGATVASLLGMFGRYLGRGGIAFAAAGLFRVFATDIVNGALDVLSSVLPDSWEKYLRDNNATIASELSEAVDWGLISWAFLGKRIGMIVFAGKLLGSFFTSALEYAGLVDGEGQATSKFINKILGTDFEIPNGFYIEMGSIVALLFGPKIIGSLMRGMFFRQAATRGAATVAGSGLLGSVWTKMKGGFKTGWGKGLGIGAGIALAGTIIAEVLDGFGLDPQFGDMIRDSAMIAATGGLLGIPGLIVGSILGLFYAGTRLIAKFYEDRQEQLFKDIDLASATMTGEYAKAFTAGDKDLAANVAMRLSSNMLQANEETKAAYIPKLEQMVADLERNKSLLTAVGQIDLAAAQMQLQTLKEGIEKPRPTGKVLTDVSGEGNLSQNMFYGVDIGGLVRRAQQEGSSADQIYSALSMNQQLATGMSYMNPVERENALRRLSRSIADGTYTGIQNMYRMSGRDRDIISPAPKTVDYGEFGHSSYSSSPPAIVAPVDASQTNNNNINTSQYNFNGDTVDMKDRMYYGMAVKML